MISINRLILRLNYESRCAPAIESDPSDIDMDYVELTEEERASILADPEFLELIGEYFKLS